MIEERYRTVCSEKECTACNSCVNICPRKCIVYKTDNTGTKSAAIDGKSCIECHMCEKACPQMNEATGTVPSICYAAWSKDEEIRNNSASGGIATELYKVFALEGGTFAGVKLSDLFEAEYQLLSTIDSIRTFQNSKYVYSDTKDVFKKIADNLKQKSKVLFVGLPCQVAGLRQYLHAKQLNEEGLYTVDLVCHGVTPADFLKKHVKHIENRYGQKATELYFRDPYAYTYTFTFTLKNNKGRFYQRKVHRNDTYQIGYHYGITYRENCYHCRYARPERTGDLTLADFSYVGKIAPCDYDNKNVSCVLVNTFKGKEMVDKLQTSGGVFFEKRPLEEEMETEKQLKAPTGIPAERDVFLKAYSETENFEKAMTIAARKIMVRNEVKHYLHIEDFEYLAARIVPQRLKVIIKKALGKK